MSGGSGTPLMAQYREIKAQHTNTILFFRMGDFYEMFYEDAEVAARALDLTLTSRNNGAAAEVPLAGIPVKAAADYIRRLVQQGYRVAICEQIEDPKVAKGIVKRAVVETITPGAAFSDDLLDASRNTFLAAIALGSDGVGFAAADLSTGEFRLVRCTREDLDAVLARLAPRELLVATGTSLEGVTRADDLLTTPREGWEFDPALASDALVQHFGVASLEGFGLDATRDAAAIGAAGALLRYLKELQPGGVPHLMRPTIERPGGVMPLDEMTRRNLELVDSLRATDDTSGTLIGVLDRTQTPMGARLLRQWILAP
ncbi:MAG: DNA mismatch repair protein MutS, partial [Gemmatimonadota bacterium]